MTNAGKEVSLNRRTLGSVLRFHGGIGPGFDAMRLGLSLAIMVVHSVPLTHGFSYFDYREWVGYPFFMGLLPMFFSLSGFLVAGSAVRLRSTYKFMLNRGLRILPALAVEVALSAVFLGALVTSLPLVDYYGDPQFIAYFKNIIGIVQFDLPGVFENNPFPRTVNGNLWTLQPEYYCYLIIAALMLMGVFRHHRWYSALALLVFVGAVIADILWKVGLPFYAVSPATLVLCFLAGNVFFLLADRIPFDGRLALASLVIYWVLSQVAGGVFLSMLFLCYLKIFVGLVRIPTPGLLRRSDYSYGIYLYGFPIQQALMHYFPGISAWWLMGVMSIGLTMMFSIFSWHWIERPVLSLRNRI